MIEEETLAMIKPDGVAFNINAWVLNAYHDAGLRATRRKMFRFDQKLAAEFYQEHRDQNFFQNLVTFMVSGQSFGMVIRGQNAVATVRRINGATNPLEALPGSIRWKFRKHFSLTNRAANFIHGSDSLKAAQREIKLIFG